MRDEMMAVTRINIKSSATAAVAVRLPVFGFPTIIPDKDLATTWRVSFFSGRTAKGLAPKVRERSRQMPPEHAI